MSPDTARSEAVRLFESARIGTDPTAHRRSVRQSERLSEVFERYQRETRAFRKPATFAFNSAQWNQHLSRRFGGMNVRTITPEHVRDFMIDYADRKRTANNALSVLRKLLNFAKVTPNPCSGMSNFRVERPIRVLTSDELSRIDSELWKLPEWFDLLIRLLSLTGARLREIMCAETAWVDLERQVLSLPDSKTGAKVIRLPSEACELLRGCHKRRFIIQEVGKDKPVAFPYKSWRKLCVACGFKGVRLHDIRHSFGSRAHAAGLSQRQIAYLLGHKSLTTTEKYLHHFDTGVSPIEIAATSMFPKRH